MKSSRSIFTFAACGLLAIATQANAATITPNILSDPAVGSDNANCSLRYAVISINDGVTFTGGCQAFSTGTLGDDDTIMLDGETYVLTIPPGDPADETGDLNVVADIAIIGVGSAQTTIDASGMSPGDRIIEIEDIFNASITGVTLTGGDRTSQGGNGGAILSEAQNLDLEDVHVIENTANSGGGIALEGGIDQEITLVGSTVELNHSTDGCGGGLSVFFPGDIGPIENALGILGSTINNNDTNGSGGGICQFGNIAMFLADTTISTNTAVSSGGGIAAGGLQFSSGLKGSYNVTIAFNTVTSTDGRGGGIEASTEHNPDFPAEIFNTIIANNTATSGPDCFGDFLSGGNNLIGNDGGDNDGEPICDGFVNGTDGDQVGTTATPIDPLLGPLAVNGGTTFTHALLTGSPAIDKGNSDEGCQVIDFQAYVDGGFTNPTFVDLTVDQRELTRPVAILDPNVPICDIGAFEVQIPTPSPSPSPSVIPTNTLDISGNGCSLSAIAGSPVALFWMGLALLAGWFQLRSRK